MARMNPPTSFNWEKVGKGSAVSVPVGAVGVLLWQMLGGYVEQIDKEFDKKADVVKVEALASQVDDYENDIDELRKEQVQQGKQLEQIETKQEQVIKGQDRILDAIEDKDEDRKRDNR